MNRNTTIALVIAFAVLLVYVLLVQRPADEAAQTATDTPTPASQTTGQVWPGLQADQILSVRIEDRAQDRAVAFGRADAAGSWNVTEPEAKTADQLAVASHAASVANLSYQDLITGTTDLAAFGVLSPTYSIELKLVDGTLRKAVIGDKTVTGSGYYLAREGEQAVLVVSSFPLDTLLGLVETPPYLEPTATPPNTTSTPVVTVTP